jgi:hypothetical protein
LLTTAFLGLRRYLRQRRLEMPLTITSVWLTTGGGLLLALLVVGAILPRPYAEYTLVDAAKLAASKERSASNYSVKDGDTGKESGRPSSDKTSDEKGTPGSQTRPGKDGKGQSQSKSSQGDKKSDSSGKSQDGDQKKSSDQNDNAKQRGDQTRDQKDGSGDKSSKSDAKNAKSESSSRSGSSRPSSPRSSNLIPRVPPGVSNVLRWAVYIVLALAGLWFLIQFLANFTNWAKWLVDLLRDFWQGLFGGWGGRTETEADEAEPEPARPAPRPFSAYYNPFLSGTPPAPEEIVRYSFEALEAFAAELDLERGAEETALEFADRLGHAIPALEADVHRLAAFYARAAYGRGRLPDSSLDALRQFWDNLNAAYQQTPAAR